MNTDRSLTMTGIFDSSSFLSSELGTTIYLYGACNDFSLAALAME
jgi:hypothetical protein